MCLAMTLVFMSGAVQMETFNAPGFDVPVCGALYAPGEANSAMPLGGLGTGFVDITSSGNFGDSTTENNWLKPSTVAAKSGIIVRIGEKEACLLPGVGAPEGLRFWGHYPAADVDLGSTFPGVSARFRALAPLIPHDYDLSGLPAALFHFTLSNTGSALVPAEVALQWQVEPRTPFESRGNVEGALGWRREALPPGKAWTVTPILAFAPDRGQIEERARTARPAAELLMKVGEVSDVPEGRAYECGAVTDFLVDAVGGFNWETHRRESAVFGGTPNIGQMFWRLSYEGGAAGRGMDGPYGLVGQAFPTQTADRRIELDLRVYQAGNDGFALIFTLVNVSDKELRDLRFGFCINADVGGPEKVEKQRAKLDANVGGIVFETDGVPAVLGLVGDAQDCIVDIWPNAHQDMVKAHWTPATGESITPKAQAFANGIQLVMPEGSYAVGACPVEGWSIQSAQCEPGVIRTLAKRDLQPGETVDLTLGLGWYFPYWTSSDGETLRHRYAVSHADAGAVLAAVLPRADEIEKRVIAWQKTIYASTAPALLKDAVINSLYILPRNSWWISDGRFFQSESFTGCPITETFVCRYYGSFPLALMFPECERATMRSVADAQAPTGEIPFGFGSPLGSRSPYFHVQHPIVSSEFALTAWRNFAMWWDAKYLEEMYPRVQAALRFAMTLDKDGDGLVNEDPGNEKGFPANQYYDIWPWWGTSAYTGSIWLAALRAGENMARIKGDTAFADELRDWFERGAKAFEEKLWTGAYYRLYNDPERKRVSDTSLANALCGQWFAYVTGLGELVPPDHINSVIDTVLRLNVAVTPFGAVNGATPEGKPDETFPDHSAVITIGEVWTFCAMSTFAGRKDDAIRLFETSYSNVLLNQRTPWNIPWCLDRTTGAIRWGINYYSNPCVWTLLQALDPATYGALCSKDRD